MGPSGVVIAVWVDVAVHEGVEGSAVGVVEGDGGGVFEDVLDTTKNSPPCACTCSNPRSSTSTPSCRWLVVMSPPLP